MKKILISIPWFYPAFRAGGPVQSIVNMVNELDGAYEFYIFCGNKDLNNISLENIKEGEWVSYNSYTKIWYASAKNRKGTLVQLLKDIHPDHLFIIGLFSWQFNIVPLLFCKCSSKIVSVRGMLHTGALSQKSIKKVIYLKAFKLLGLQKKVTFHATDEAEEIHVRKVMGQKIRILTANNFPRFIGKLPTTKKEPQSLILVSIALISAMKNHLLVLQALEHCDANIEYHIYGPVKDLAYWQVCLGQIDKLPPNIHVQYHGDVQPQEIPSVLSPCHIFIIPSNSENFGHAFFEALSAGKPIITSNFTPWQNLRDAQAGINTELDEDAIARSVEIFAAMDQYYYNLWSNSAFEYAKKAVNLTQIRESYYRLFN